MTTPEIPRERIDEQRMNSVVSEQSAQESLTSTLGCTDGHGSEHLLTRRQFMRLTAVAAGVELFRGPADPALQESQGELTYDRPTGLLSGVVGGGLLAAGLKLSFRATICFIAAGGALGYCSGQDK